MYATDHDSDVDVVIPSVGRPSLERLLLGLARRHGPRPRAVIVVDDRAFWAEPLPIPHTGTWLDGRVRVISSGGKGPAGARNVGWRAGTAPWVAFLDDDVEPRDGWLGALADDLRDLPAGVAGSQGRVYVPATTTARERMTDWQRNVKSLEESAWITADMAYRRGALEAADGFDELFPRAYREDSDLALRLLRAGWKLVDGERGVVHPVPDAGPLVSVTKQRGNADDAVMRWLHGGSWRAEVNAPRGTLREHCLTVIAGVTAAGSVIIGRRGIGALLAAVWAAMFGRFAARRIAPGPKNRREISTMLLTSALIPPVAAFESLLGQVRGAFAVWRRGRSGRERSRKARAAGPPPDAVLFDRDGTLIEDVPYNGDPDLVEPAADARWALECLRAAGVKIGVVTNQSGIARKLIDRPAVDRVNARVDEMLGPFATWQICPHAPEDGCSCRKPAAELIRRAADELGVDPTDCVMIGDIGSDMEAARAAGAKAIMVPTPVTRREEVAAAPRVAPNLGAAIEELLVGAER